MNFSLTPEQQSIQDMARQFAKNSLAPYASVWDRDSFFPVETIKNAGSLGLGGLFIDEKFGGTNLSRTDGILIFEELSQGCVSTAAYLSIHNMVGGLIQKFGTPTQHERWLPHLSSLEWLSSYCLTEPNAGSDAASLQTKAVRDGDYYIVNGAKAFISGGGVSDFYLCMVRTGEAGARGISALIIEKNTPGLSFGQHEEKMGWRSQPTTTVMFDNCRVPAENLLGMEGSGFKIAMTGLNGGRLNIAACSLGGGQFCFDAAKKYVTERQQFGAKIADFQAIQFRLADMATDLQAARLLTYQAGFQLDTNHPSAVLSCAMAKRFATDAGSRVVDQALQLHGGYGYIKDYQIERHLRDLRVHQILEGTNEVMRMIIARHIFA